MSTVCLFFHWGFVRLGICQLRILSTLGFVHWGFRPLETLSAGGFVHCGICPLRVLSGEGLSTWSFVRGVLFTLLLEVLSTGGFVRGILSVGFFFRWRFCPLGVLFVGCRSWGLCQLVFLSTVGFVCGCFVRGCFVRRVLSVGVLSVGVLSVVVFSVFFFFVGFSPEGFCSWGFVRGVLSEYCLLVVLSIGGFVRWALIH